jgi:hypothetical protein
VRLCTQIQSAKESVQPQENLIEQLTKMAHKLSSPHVRLAPIAFRCLLDLCKAASRAPLKPGQELPLRGLAIDIIHEIKVNHYD